MGAEGGIGVEEGSLIKDEFSRKKSEPNVQFEKIKKAVTSDKGKVVGSLFSVVVLVLPIMMQGGGIFEEYHIDELPVTKYFDNASNETATIHITGITESDFYDRVVLVVTFNMSGGYYPSVLFVNGQSYGFLEYQYTIFTIPTTSDVTLVFGAYQLRMKIDKLGDDQIVWNDDIQNVVVKGKTYWEEYQRYWNGAYWGHRSIVSLPERNPFMPRHSVNVTSPDGVRLKHMALNDEGIFDYNELYWGSGYRNVTLRSDTTYFKVWTNDSNFYRLQFNWKEPAPTQAKEAHADIGFKVGGEGSKGSEDDPIVLSDYTPDEGDLVDIDVKVKNSGSVGTGYFNTTVYLDRVNNTTMIGNNQTMLGAGASTTVSFYWDTNGTFGNHTVRVLLDQDNYIHEWNESNHESVEVFVNSSKLSQDGDGDNLPDPWEDEWGLNSSDASGDNGTYGDPDQDGLHNLAEYQNNTLPKVADTDNDTLLDGDNNTLILLRLVKLEEKSQFDIHEYFLIVSRFETEGGGDVPYGGYRIPTQSNQYINISNGQPNENLSKSYIVKEMPLEVFNKGNDTAVGEFYITADKVNLSSESETPFDFENDDIRIRVNASLIMNATSDPNPLVKDADWDGLDDAWEMVYLDTRAIDFRGMDSDSDGVDDILDVDSDNDHATDGGDMRLFYFPVYPEEEYDYPLVQVSVKPSNDAAFGYRYPEYGINQSSSALLEIGITDPEQMDVDADSLKDGDERRLWGSDPTLKDTDADLMDDGLEVNGWFFYDNVSIDEKFFDSDWNARMNITAYHEAHFNATIYSDVRTNVTTEQNISNSINITIEENSEFASKLVDLNYTTYYDSSGLDSSFTWIPVLFNFTFERTEDNPSIWITPNPDVFPKNLSDLEVYLNYSIVKILGSDVTAGDSDGDGLDDYTELDIGTSIMKRDTDSDMMWDTAENNYWFWENWLESKYQRAMKMRDSDWDDDGLLDGYEILYTSDPSVADEDNDQLDDEEEILTFVTVWYHKIDPEDDPPLVNDGTFEHEFLVHSNGDYLFTLTLNNTINRSIEYYDEDRLYDDDYMDEVNTMFMNNSSTVKYCHQPFPSPEYCRQAKYDSDAMILNVTRYEDRVNISETRKVYIFQNVTSKTIQGFMEYDLYSVEYELDVNESGSLAIANFTLFVASKRGVHPFISDFDTDGLIDSIEVNTGSNPFYMHSDEDWLNDFDEYNGTYGPKTNLTDEDTDGDGLWDGYNIVSGYTILHWGELSVGTNATNVDSDGDDLWDQYNVSHHKGEWSYGTNSTNWDTDSDSMPDGWEVDNNLNPTTDDGGLDADLDGLNNSQEYVTGTDPQDKDIDDDQLWDGEEVTGVLFRTNVSNGARSIDNYETQEGYKWIFYNATDHKKYEYNNQSADTWWVICDVPEDPLGTQDGPRIYGDYIVWEDNRNGHWDIYYYNMSNETEVRVTDETQSQRYPDIFGDIIVWQDKRNANWDIWAYNISSGEEMRITENETDETDPSIYGDTIVWVDKRHGNESNGYQTEIYMYNLKEEYEVRITNDSYNETSPMIYESSIVWLDDNYSSDNVYLHQPSGSRYLVNDSHEQKNPQIHDNYVVWEDYRDGNWEIYLHDLKLDNQTRITNIISNQTNVSIYGDKLLWEDYRDGNTEIYLYNITTGVNVKITDDSDAQARPAIFEDRFVWVDERNESKDIYAFNLTQFGTLGDGAPLFYNPIREEIYVWKHDDWHYRFNETDSSEPCTVDVPHIGYQGRELYEGPNPRHPDSDFDGLLDGRNSTVANDSALFFYYLNYSLPYIDNENGTATFIGEKSNNTNPLRPDTDDDNIKDWQEIFGYNVSIKRANGTVEEKVVYTDPTVDDTDNDRLIDGRETSFKTDPTHPDADEDSLIDGYNVTVENGSELFQFFDNLGIRYIDNQDGNVTFVGELSMGVSPTSNESDGDALTDETEVFDVGTHPAYIDTEKDGLPDGYEIFYGLNATGNDTAGDLDYDGFTNVHEYLYGTDPTHWDTDFDGMPDTWEWEFGFIPLDNGSDVYERRHNKSFNIWYYDILTDEGNATRGPDGDFDSDNMTNVEEYSYMKPGAWNETVNGTWWSGLSPTNWDTDDDNLSDSSEVFSDTYWWEAENYTDNDPVNESDNLASGGYAAAATDSNSVVFQVNWSLPGPSKGYKIYVKARKTGDSDGTLEIYNHTSLLFTLTIDSDTYGWYNSSNDPDLTGEGDIRIRGVDTNATKPSVYVDKLFLTTFGSILVDKVYDAEEEEEKCPLSFDMDDKTTIYVRIPVDSSKRKYVSNATLYMNGSDPKPANNATMNTGDKTKAKGLQWWHYLDFVEANESATLDLAGEFNQYLSNHTDDDEDGYINIPLKFDADANGVITVYAVVVLLVPFISDPLDNDTDSDWLEDGKEKKQYETSSLAGDSDNDLITDWSEVSEDQDNETGGTQLTDPTDSDTDDDLDDDYWDLNPTIADKDYDGLLDGIENRTGTNRSDPDTDDDGLVDGFNVTVKNTSDAYWFLINHTLLHEAVNDTYTKFFGELSFGTNNLRQDTDGDELSDGSEVSGGTDPLNPDTDGDGLLDGGCVDIAESGWRYNVFMSLAIVIMNGSFKGENYKGTNNTTADTDEDGFPDGWEVKFWMDPTSAEGKHGPDGDLDGDGICNSDEYFYQTNPNSDDTDFDGLPDDWEINYGLDPLNNGSEKYVLKANYDYETFDEVSVDDGPDGDPDGDGYTNVLEYTSETSPTNADTDGDGLIDGSTTEVLRSDWQFKIWEAQGIPYLRLTGYSVKFLGEVDYSTSPLDPDCDDDGATDSQEVYGYNVMITWYEGDDLKSANKTIYGAPWGYYKEPDNTTLLDIDEDGITDIDEMDPVNSSTPSVLQYVARYGDNQSMMDSQFNPFIRENNPPVVLNVKIKKHEIWEWVWVIIPFPVLKRAWTEVHVEAIDVAEYTVTIRINDNYARSATFTGKGHQWFHAELDLNLWDVLVRYKVTVNMVDFAGNELDPPYTEEVDGFFGGVLRFLEALWDFLVALACLIADAIMAAINFIIDLIVDLIMALVDAILDPILDAIEAWQRNVGDAINEVFTERSDPIVMVDPTRSYQIIEDAMMFGSLMGAMTGLMVTLGIITQILTPLQFTPIGLIIAVAFSLIVPLIIQIIFGMGEGQGAAHTVDESFENPGDTWGISFVIDPDDPWWDTQLALGIMSLIPSAIVGLMKMNRANFFKMDIFGVIISAFGLLTCFIGGEPAFWLGFILAMWGWWITLEDDIFDMTQPNPLLKRWEEIITSITLLFYFYMACNQYL